MVSNNFVMFIIKMLIGADSYYDPCLEVMFWLVWLKKEHLVFELTL